jgi:hypothetical protein
MPLAIGQLAHLPWEIGSTSTIFRWRFGDNHSSGGPSVQADRIRKLALADFFLATLAVGIVIGFPVWHWISALL